MASFAGLEFLLDEYYSEGHSQNWTMFHPERGWTLVPGDYFYKPPRDLRKISIHIDKNGLRSRSKGDERPKARRVMVLGDSFVFAGESSFVETFGQRLETLLNQRVSSGVEVLNAGVLAYGTGQELLLFRALSENDQTRSNVYLLMFFTHDILDNLCLSYGDLQFEPVRPCFTLDAAGKPVLSNLPKNRPDYEDDTLAAVKKKQFGDATFSIVRAWAEERFQSQGKLVEILVRFGISPQIGRMPGVLNAWYHDKVVEKGVPLTAALIAEMKQEIDQKGGQLIVSMVPSIFQMYPETYIPILQKSFPGNPLVERFTSDARRPQRILRDICQKVGVPFLDLLPTLAEHRDIPLFIPRDGHLTPAGHKLTSEVLLPFVLEHLPKDTDANRSHQSHAIPDPD